MHDPYRGRRPTTAVERTIAAPAGRVWSLIADPDMPARFSAEYQGGRWLDGVHGPALGARFVGRNRNDVMGEWHTICHVIECDPPHRFAWAVNHVERPSATWRFTLTPEGQRVTLRFEAVLGPGPSGLTEAIRDHPQRRDAMIAWRLNDLRSNMQEVVDGVAALAEAP